MKIFKMIKKNKRTSSNLVRNIFEGIIPPDQVKIRSKANRPFLKKMNFIGIVLVLILTIIGIQHFFKIITLNPETYYVATMPVYISFTAILLLNIGTLILCFLMLIIPSFIITKISPSKSIKFA